MCTLSSSTSYSCLKLQSSFTSFTACMIGKEPASKSITSLSLRLFVVWCGKTIHHAVLVSETISTQAKLLFWKWAVWSGRCRSLRARFKDSESEISGRESKGGVHWSISPPFFLPQKEKWGWIYLYLSKLRVLITPSEIYFCQKNVHMFSWDPSEWAGCRESAGWSFA